MPCRFDPDPNVPAGTIHFYFTDLPFLDTETVFNNREWNTEVLGPLTLGCERAPKPGDYNGLWSIPGLLGGHVCGPITDFVTGLTGTEEPLEAGPDGIPTCCPRAVPGLVTMGMWPQSSVSSWVGPAYPTSGGFTLRQFALTPTPTPPTKGGFTLRQFALPPTPTPPATGGIRVGGFVLDPTPVPPLRVMGGVAVGGTLGSPVVVNPPSGGVAVGGAVQSSVTYNPPSGGVAVGGVVNPPVPLPVPYVSGGVAVGGPGNPYDTSMIPIGGEIMFEGTNIPAGFLLCDGSSFSSATYPALALVLGGTTLPDYRGRSPLGAGQGTGLSNRVLGTSAGEENHQLSQSELAQHLHVTAEATSGHEATGYGLTLSANFTDRVMVQEPYASGTATTITGGNTAHNTMHPWHCSNIIIRAQ